MGKKRVCQENQKLVVKKSMVKIIHRLNESTTKISKDKAIEITKRFLEQHHSVSGASAVLRGKEWFVTMCIGMSNNDTRQVRIDANTGKILDYT